MAQVGEITKLLREAEDGRDGALDDLMTMVYSDLERLADIHLNRQFGDKANAITLEPAALVNESFMTLIRQRNTYDNRGQFFAIATRVMLRVLIDYRRRRNAAKRGGGQSRITLMLDECQVAEPTGARSAVIEVERLQEALAALESLDSRKADVVRMRIVWGLDLDEISRSLDVSRSTVERDWRFAKAWLADEIGLTEQLD